MCQSRLRTFHANMIQICQIMLVALSSFGGMIFSENRDGHFFEIMP
jgi:hypothetical protein